MDVQRGSRRPRVDSVDFSRGETISRKFTQLAKIKIETAIRYLAELQNKYAPGMRVANTPRNRELGIGGRLLPKRQVLEVPTQQKAVPAAVIDEATRRRIVIRDEDGNEY